MEPLERILQVEQELKLLLQDCIAICEAIEQGQDRSDTASALFDRLRRIRQGFLDVANALPVPGLPIFNPTLRQSILTRLEDIESSWMHKTIE